MLLAVGLDPFFQQVVSLAQRQIIQPGRNATIPSLIGYASDDSFTTRNGTRMNFNDQLLQPIFESYFYGQESQATIVGPQGSGSPNIPIDCPTDNCTWPVFDSLAVCSECRDISRHLTFGCRTTQADWTKDINVTPKSINDTWPTSTACGYFLNATSATPMLMAGYVLNQDGTLGQALITRTLDVANVPAQQVYWGDGSLNFRDVTDKFIDFLIVGVDGPPASIYSSGAKVNANECVLTWCVNSYQSVYQEGQFTEVVTQSFHNTTLAPFPYRNINSSVHGAMYEYARDISLSSPTHEGATSFNVAARTQMQVLAAWWEFLPSFATIDNATSNASLRHMNWENPPGYLRQFDQNPWLSPNNVSQRMEQLASTITNAMRSTNNTEHILGLAFTSEVYVKVSWAWMILPLIVLFASLAFLIATVRQSSQGPQTWKNSAVATLMHALPGEVQQRLQHTDPHTLANELTIKLAPDRGGWRMSFAMDQAANAPRVMSPRLQSDRPGWI